MKKIFILIAFTAGINLSAQTKLYVSDADTYVAETNMIAIFLV